MSSGLASMKISLVTGLSSATWVFPGFHGALERRQTVVPKNFEECPQLAKSLRADPIKPPRTVAPHRQQAGLRHQAQMLRNRLPRRSKMRGNFASRQFLLMDKAHDSDTTRLGERLHKLGQALQCFRSSLRCHDLARRG